MDACPPQEPPDLSLQLPRDTYHLVVQRLRKSLPPPTPNTPDERARCERAAIAEVASLLPANAEEATLAVDFVAASARSLEDLAEANHYKPNDPEFAHKCQAQARSMMREARGFRSLLLRVQAARHKREADGAALCKAEWIEHCAIGLMADAAGIAPPRAMPEPPSPPAPPPAEEEEPAPDLAAEADRYAIIYPRRAALIRASGGLPPRCDFGPPSPELAHAIATGTSPTLRALDSPAEAVV